MKPLGRTIRLFLVDGSPLGLIAAEIIGWTGKILSFPRGLLPDVLRRPEIAKTGLYFLVGPDPENPLRPLVYIGESDDVAKRLKQHDSSEDKDFFEQVALLVSKDENLTKSHVRYLETRLIEIIRGIGSASLKNGNQGSPVLLPESEQADMEYVLQQLQVLMPVLGFPFLQELPRRTQKVQVPDRIPVDLIPDFSTGSETVFELSIFGGKIHAEAYEEEGQFVVTAGSTCRHPDFVTQAMRNGRNAGALADLENSLKAGLLLPLEDDFEIVRLTRDKAFKSPSGAASFVCGNPKNGKIEWLVKGAKQTYGEWRELQMEATEHVKLTIEEALV